MEMSRSGMGGEEGHRLNNAGVDSFANPQGRERGTESPLERVKKGILEIAEKNNWVNEGGKLDPYHTNIEFWKRELIEAKVLNETDTKFSGGKGLVEDALEALGVEFDQDEQQEQRG